MRLNLLLALLITLALPALAVGHAVPVEITPRGAEILDASPERVRITFSEEIQLLNSRDADVLDQNGQSALGGPAFVDPSDVRVLILPLRPDLLDGTYTVGWRVMGQDTHVVPGQTLFGVGVDELASPVAVAGGGAPSETGPWAVSARTIHLAALGGLLGLLAFRWLVWRRAWKDAPALDARERRTMLEWGRDQFWFAFGTLALFAMITEAYLLVVKSAIANGLSLLANLQNPEGITEVLANTRFGDLVQLRGALLFVVFGTATWQFLSEFGSSRDPKPAAPVDKIFPSALMGGLLIAILLGVASSGHATVAPLPVFHIAVHAVHLAALATWIAGLVATLVVLRQLPKIASNGGRSMATRVLGAFSTVATVAIGVAFVTGAIRAFGHLDGPEQLITTTYGNLILLKLALLVPIAVLALRSRRVLNALKRIPRPSEAALLLVRRSVALEIAVTLVIIVTAGVLAASEPGRL